MLEKKGKRSSSPSPYAPNKLPTLPSNKSSKKKLPYLPPSISMEGRSKKQFRMQQINLPVLQTQFREKKSNRYPNTERRKQNDSIDGVESLIEGEVEMKLRKVLKEGGKDHVDDASGSTDFDFHLKVQKNKQIIQQYKRKKERFGERKQIETDQKLIRNESKEKSEIIKKYKFPLSFKNRKSIQIQKGKDRLSPANKSSDRRSILNPKKLSPPGKKNQESIKKFEKDVNLFDSIQNYLDNPQKFHKKEQKILVGLSLLQARRNIESRIKQIDDKLGTEMKTTSTKFDEEKTTAKGWKHAKKIEQHLNFDVQLDKISSLEQKSRFSLEQYLNYQKMLIDIEYQKHQTPKNN